MGEDARWVCHTCKTVCSRGGRPIFQFIPDDLSIGDIDNLKKQIVGLSREIVIENEGNIVSFLDDLRTWLSRHIGHKTHIGSDYSTDVMDLDDYHNEAISGEVSSLTRHEARMESVNEWELKTIREIEQVIGEHSTEIKAGDTGPVARELYHRFR